MVVGRWHFTAEQMYANWH